MMPAVGVKAKLIFWVFLSLAVATSAGLYLSTQHDIQRLDQHGMERAEALGTLINDDVIEILAMGSVERAAHLTQKLDRLDSIRQLLIQDQGENPLFEYRKTDFDTQTVDQRYNLHHRFEISTDDRSYGYADISFYNKSAADYYSSLIERIAAILFGMLVAAILLMHLVDSLLISPVQRLATTFRKFGKKEDYSLHLPVERHDEIGELFDGFNMMQEAIQLANSGRIAMQHALDQHAIVAITDVQGNITYVNDKFIEISGYSRDELLGQNHRILNSGAHDKEFFRSMYSSIANGEIWHGEICNKAKDGALYWVDTTIVPQLNRSGKPDRYVAMRTDITSLKATQQELSNSEEFFRESEERWQFALEGSGDGVWDWNAETDEVFFSKRWKQMLGYEEHEVGNTLDDWESRVHPDDKAACYADLQKHFDGEVPYYENEHRVLCKDGSYKWILDRGKVISRDDDGKPLRVIGTHTDISDKKLAEDAIRRTQKMEAVDQLTGGIAHDFNNILGIIQGNVSLLKTKADSLDEKTLKRIDTIEVSAQRAIDLTKSLLGFSTRQMPCRKVVDVNDKLSNIKELIAHSLTPQIELKYYLQDDLWNTEIEEGDLTDAVVNLAINARDAMHGEGCITVITENETLKGSCVPGLEPGDYVVLVVSDTGDGIPKEEMERIFEPYFTTKPQGKGSGLGLAMVYGFVSRSGGSIQVDSRVGVGTTFRIYLPRSRADIAETENDSTEKITEVVDSRARVLVVDDEPALLELVREILKPLGYDILTADSPASALDMFESENETIDLLLTDVVMPGGMNGIELADKILQQYPDTRILLSSGYTEMAIANNINERIGTELLVKPYDTSQLIESVQQALTTASPKPESARG